MAPLPVRKAPARRRERFPYVTNTCAFASARSSRRPLGFRLAVPPRYHPQQGRPDRSIIITSTVRQMAAHGSLAFAFSSTVTLPA